MDLNLFCKLDHLVAQRTEYLSLYQTLRLFLDQYRWSSRCQAACPAEHLGNHQDIVECTKGIEADQSNRGIKGRNNNPFVSSEALSRNHTVRENEGE